MTVANAFLMGWEADTTMRGMLKDPPEETPAWFRICDQAFTCFFFLELIFRIWAEGMWFLLSPADWKWNYVDICLVLSNILSDFNIGFNLSFFRLLRVF